MLNQYLTHEENYLTSEFLKGEFKKYGLLLHVATLLQFFL